MSFPRLARPDGTTVVGGAPRLAGGMSTKTDGFSSSRPRQTTLLVANLEEIPQGDA